MKLSFRNSRLICVSLVFLGAMATVGGPLRAADVLAPRAQKPNIIFILADDLGYGDLGCFGQKRIKTPNLDRMAAEGMKLTQFYAGDTVCAPSRCVLMTGMHTGHSRIRGNASLPLLPEDVTVAEVLKKAGYQTGLVGKWGLGEAGSSGVPNKKGFDYFFGFLNQVHAHNYYPSYLWKNEEKFPLKNVLGPGAKSGGVGDAADAGVSEKKVDYAPDFFTKEAMSFVERSRNAPFFLYLAYTIPHANDEAAKDGEEVPDQGEYAKESWPKVEKDKAAMITRLDRDIGKLFALLKNLGIDDNTCVLFTSDNGPHKEGGVDPKFFNSSGPLRGIKRDLYEGGIREPSIVRWPGRTPAGSTGDFAGTFQDFLATAAELVGAEAPKTDGISMVPTILGKPADQKQHESLYWEFHEQGGAQAVRMGDWKAIHKPLVNGKTELYDLKSDLAEKMDVAAKNPEIVKKMEAIMKDSHVQSPDFPMPGETGRDEKKAKKAGKAKKAAAE